MIYKTTSNEIEDIDEKGKVVVAANAIGNEDADHDISMPGSFNKTLKNDFNRLRWFLNHDTSILLGVPIEGKEEDSVLKITSQFNMKKQVSLDTYEDYKLYASFGKSLEHSIGVKDIKRDKEDSRKVMEWHLFEFSTLTSWGANPLTPMLEIKSMSIDEAQQRIKMLEKGFYGKYSEARLKAMERTLGMIKKAVMGEMIVKCGCCNSVFDYNSADEQTLHEKVAEIVGMYQKWLNDGIAYEEMQKLDESVRVEAMSIIGSNKSIAESIHFVRCPKCYSKVYKDNVIVNNPEVSGKLNIRQILSKL